MQSQQGNWDWRKMNEDAGLVAADDCRHCSGMGRVPIGTVDCGGIICARYGDCPTCSGTGKKAVQP